MRIIITGRLEQQNWETAEGEKRSSLEVAIDEIGPSLRWATATGTKTPLADSAAGDGGRGLAAGPVGRDEYPPDEAPF